MSLMAAVSVDLVEGAVQAEVGSAFDAGANTAAQPDATLSKVSFLDQNGDERGAAFVVPEQDPSLFTADRLMRSYDVHVAKMVEITDYECRQPKRLWSRVQWRYLVGRVYVGNIKISCDAARDAAIAYGFSRPEQRPVHYYNSPAVVTVPVLNLNRANADRWMDFAQTLLPTPPLADDPGVSAFGN
jgi:hypothetical protein